jgi:GTP cyclohydrolase II
MREQSPTLQVNRAVADYRLGRPVLIVDPNEACLALSAELATADAVALLASVAENPPVLAITESRGRALNIKPSGHGVILLEAKSWLNLASMQTLADATTDMDMPLRGPFERRKGTPSASKSSAIQLAKHARLLPSAIVAAVPLSDVAQLADHHNLLIVFADQITDYEEEAALSLRPVAQAKVPLADAENSRIIAFRPADGGVEHLAIVIGEPAPSSAVLIRLHSECFTGDLLGSMKCDCGEQLRGAIQEIEQTGAGILLYLAQEGRGIGLMNKLRAYRLQQDGFDTVDANLRLGFDADERIFRPAAQMLRLLGYKKVRLMTNNPDKVDGLRDCGIEVTERVEHIFTANRHNEFYLQTKKTRSGHML